MVGRERIHNRRLDVIAVLQRAVVDAIAAKHDASAGCERVVHRLLPSVHRALIHHGPHKGCAFGRKTDVNARRSVFDETVNEFAFDGFGDIGARGGGTFLTAETERAARRSFRRHIQIGVFGNDDGILAAHFGNDRFQILDAEIAIEVHPDIIRTGKGDAVNHWIHAQLFADGRAGAHDEIENAVGQAGVHQTFGEKIRADRRFGRGFLHDGIARNQRGGGHARRQRDWKIPRRDDAEHAVRQQDRLRARIFAGRGERVHKALARFNRIAIVANDFGGFVHFGDAFAARFADFECHDGGGLPRAFIHQIGGAAHDGDASFVRHASPFVRGKARGANGFDRFFAAEFGKVADRETRVGGTGVRHFRAIRGGEPYAIDQVLIMMVEFAVKLRDGLVIRNVVVF
ncbi:MAG: hypothetical protein HDKAJFGB_03920 [Anaerolineae bacterium]|nr:hypothetical protein [Anaerolineae bacterium]